MYVGIAVFEIHIEDAQSLKEKRMVVRSLKDRLRHKFEISVAEVALQDLHQRARIGIALVSASSKKIDSMLDSIERFVEEESGARLLGWTSEIVPFEEGAPLDVPHIDWQEEKEETE